MRADVVTERYGRRAFLLTTAAGLVSSRRSQAQSTVTRPVVSEQACPLDRNRFNADVLIPELRGTGKQVDVKVYHDQAHCICSASGLPRPAGMAARASWPEAALQAFQDIDAFCRRHVRTQPKAIAAALVTHEPVRQGPIARYASLARHSALPAGRPIERRFSAGSDAFRQVSSSHPATTTARRSPVNCSSQNTATTSACATTKA